MSEWRAELEAAVEAAEAAGRLVMEWYGRDPEVEAKADGSPVTVADREAERAIREMLLRRFPGDGVLGEEHGEAPGTAGRRWIIDPIDGTRSFVHGVPLFGVMVAFEVDGRPVVGVLHFPALGETVAAARGLGCQWNGRPARVSDVDALDRALVLTTGDARTLRSDPAHRADRVNPADPADPADLVAARAAAIERVGAAADTFRTWGDCYGYALVATGRAEAMLDPVLNIWDTAAVRPIIEEAGGVFTAWDGSLSHTAGHAVATNAALSATIRRML